MPKRSSNGQGLDANQTAKAIVDKATGSKESSEPPSAKNPAAVELGRLGGLKGGPARAKKLTKDKRVEIARKAAEARWKRNQDRQSGD